MKSIGQDKMHDDLEGRLISCVDRAYLPAFISQLLDEFSQFGDLILNTAVGQP